MPDTLESCRKRKSYEWQARPDLRSGDYAYARERSNKSSRHPRGYEVASHFAEVISNRRRDTAHGIVETFRGLAEQWKVETGNLSSITKAIAHPTYLRIIGLSSSSTHNELERLLLRELECEPDHWFAALAAITGENPVSPQHTFDEAVAAWLTWGRERGII